VIGGAEIFREALPHAGRIYLTRVHGAPVGDVTFPAIDWKAWRIVNSQSYPSGPKDEYAFTFSVLERR
jgi:dihydrofolate reductase